MGSKILYIFIFIIVIGCGTTYLCLDNYVFTVKVHVPLFGYIDTGLTKDQISEFILATKYYDSMKHEVGLMYRDGKIDSKNHLELINEINLRSLSDPRITTVTSGPAKAISKFLLNKI